jgi:hypothetical protein
LKHFSTPWYSWNIAESGVKHQKSNQIKSRNSRLDHSDSTTEMRWALKRDRKIRFDEKVKEYLRGIFAGGKVVTYIE